MPQATISIVSHGHGELLHRTLGDLQQQSVRSQLHVRVTLNLPGEELDLAAFPGLHIHVLRNSTPQGFGANHNAALCDAPGDWFFVVNPDVRITDVDAIQKLMRAGPAMPTSSPMLGLRAPRIISSDGKPEDAVRANLSPWSLVARHGLNRREALPVTSTQIGQPFFWVAGMFMAIPSAVYREIGGFDERYFLYCEDYDISARIYLRGYRLEIRDDVRVIHDGQRQSRKTGKYLRWHLQSLFRVWTSAPFWRVACSH